MSSRRRIDYYRRPSIAHRMSHSLGATAALVLVSLLSGPAVLWLAGF